MQSPRQQLEELRTIHVEERRRLVSVAVDLRQTNKEGGLWGAQVAAIQSQIEAIDRAIADERKLEPQGPTTGTLRTG